MVEAAAEVALGLRCLLITQQEKMRLFLAAAEVALGLRCLLITQQDKMRLFLAAEEEESYETE